MTDNPTLPLVERLRAAHETREAFELFNRQMLELTRDRQARAAYGRVLAGYRR